jgi:hypothetical protein
VPVRRGDERRGALVKDEPVVVHRYTTPEDIEHSENLAALGRFRKQMGSDARKAKGLGAQRRGRVVTKGGYFGGLQLIADVEARFRVPERGGRATDRTWTERRLIPMAPRTLQRLERLTAKMREQGTMNVEPIQLAGLLLEKTTDQLSERDAEHLVMSKWASR